MKRTPRRRLFLPSTLLGIFICASPHGWATPAVTTTTLAMSSGGNTIASGGSVASGAVVTLTATVKAGATGVTLGQVNFCDASAAYCTDIHLLGTAQLTSAGTAAFKFRPGVGSLSYKALFVGTSNDASSSSSTAALAVTGEDPTAAAIVPTGGPGGYTLTATVGGLGHEPSLPPPTGTVSFLDTSFGNTVLATGTLGNGAIGMNFLNSQTTPTGDLPYSVVTGDFNGDGIPDLAMANYGGTLNIFLGNGNGTFTQAANSPISLGNTTFAVAVGDFNHDGKADLAVLSGYYQGTVTIFLANGDGTFTQSSGSPIVVGGSESINEAVAVGDFNGDGILDLAVASSGPGTVTILLGNGDGTFNQAADSPISVGDGPISIAVGDLNGDGIPDLVTANVYGNSVTILLGNGNGTFTQPANSPVTVGFWPWSVAIGDFSGNGIADLAVANEYENADDPLGTSVTILMGNGKGSFTQAPGSPVTVGVQPEYIAVGDFNGDGVPDLATANNGGDSVTFLLGNGDGTFTQAANSPVFVGDFPFALAVADFTGSGVSGLAVGVDEANMSVLLPVFQTATANVTGIAPVGAGTHLVDASYAGDSNFSPSVSGTTPLTAGLVPPVFAPAPGTYTSPQMVSISESIPGATIYYATYGSQSTSGYVEYTGPFAVSAEGYEQISAYAVETGYQQSANANATYDLNLPPAATPVISLAGGVYAGTQTVTITDATSSSTIYYTTDGSYPSTSSSQFSGSVTISSSETLIALAVATGHSWSSAAIAEYLIQSSSTPFIYTVAGVGVDGYSGDGGQATIAEVNGPYKAVADSAGNVYIADTGNNRVRKVAAATGIITTLAGNGTAGFSGDTEAAIDAELNQPGSVAIDSAGNIYIADSYNYVIRKVTAATGIITTFAGTGSGYYSGDGGPATSAGLGDPFGLALDGAGNLYIGLPGDDRIRMVTAGTGIITTVAGNGQFGYSGDSGPATAAALALPNGVSVDNAGNLYIADTDNNVIRKVTASTGIITTVAGNGFDAGGYGGGYSGDGGAATSAELFWPSDTAVDAAGNFYFADKFNNAIRKVTASTNIITTITGHGNYCGFGSGDGGPAIGGSICYPQGVAVDTDGNLYVANTGEPRIQKVTVASTPPASAAAPPVFSVAGGSYSSPQTLALTDATRGAAIYVTTDGTTPNGTSPNYFQPINVSGRITIKAIAIAPGYLPSETVTAAYTITTAPAAVISTVAGNGVQGSTGIGGAATAAEIGYPQGVAVDPSGSLYFTDTQNNLVWRVAVGTGVISIYAGNGTAGYGGDEGPAISAELKNPMAIAFDKAGNLYIADTSNSVIRMVAAGTGFITTVVGNGTCGDEGDSGPATSAELCSPEGVAFDGFGNLYIADNNYDVIREVNESTGIITTFAGNKSGHYGGDGGSALAAGIPTPQAIALDSSGNLYVGDGSGRVRKVTASTGIITTIAGNGDLGYSGDGGLATNAQVLVYGLAFDTSGNLYISSYPYIVREIQASTGLITTVAGNDFYGYNGDGISATVAEMSNPGGIAFDVAGDLYIADTYNSRVRKVTFSASAPPATISTPLPGSTLTGPSETFTWTAVAGASYSLWLGTTGVGSYNLWDSGAKTVTFVTFGNLPTNGTTIYARLITTVGGTSTHVDYTYTAASQAVLSSPAPSGTLTTSNQTFAWSPGTGANAYILWLGSTGVGSNNLYTSGSTTATSATVGDLPGNGETIYARLFTSFNGAWVHADSMDTAGTFAALTSPAPGGTLPGPSVTFAWTAVTGATGYTVWLGTTGVGSYNLWDSGTISATSASVGNLPTNGEAIYARLITKVGGVSVHADYTYTAVTPGVLNSPTSGSTLAGLSQQFTWTAGIQVSGYTLLLGSTGVGSGNVYNSLITTGTSVTAGALPGNGETIYARLITTFLDGVSVHSDYTYTAATVPQAAMTSPTPGSTFTGSSVTFTWTTVAGASYSLWLGTAGVGSYNLWDSGTKTLTSVTFTNMPTNGETIYVRLTTTLDGVSQHTDYRYTAAP